MTTSELPTAYGGFTPEPVPEPIQPAPPPQPPAQAGPPVFGRRKDAARRVQFTLVAYDSQDQPTEHTLTARAAIDTASVFGLGRPGQSLGVQIEAIRKLLMRVLVDDDGIGVHTRIEQVVPRPGGDGPDDLVTVESLAPRDEHGDPDPGYSPEWSTSDLAYRTADGEVFDQTAEAIDHALEAGSSLRRFASIMDDESLWIEQSALEEIVDYLMTQAADRPTSRSSASSRSRPRKGR